MRGKTKNLFLNMLYIGSVLFAFAFAIHAIVTKEQPLSELSFMPAFEEIERAYVRTTGFPAREPYYYEFQEDELLSLYEAIKWSTVSRKTKWKNHEWAATQPYELYLQTADDTIELHFIGGQLKRGLKTTYNIENGYLISHLSNRISEQYFRNRQE